MTRQATITLNVTINAVKLTRDTWVTQDASGNNVLNATYSVGNAAAPTTPGNPMTYADYPSAAVKTGATYTLTSTDTVSAGENALLSAIMQAEGLVLGTDVVLNTAGTRIA